MRYPSRSHRAKVAVTVEILVPETDNLHVCERISGDWTRNHYARLALNRALGLTEHDTGPYLDQYEVVTAYRSKHIEGGLPLAGVTPDTTRITTTSGTEDHEAVSAESTDPSDSDSDDAVVDIGRWDFVVA
jgi:hypothetical protein